MTTLLYAVCCGGAVVASLSALLVVAGIVRSAGGRRWEQK
jgi:hypothetical protein